jgi:hypothetical protein
MSTSFPQESKVRFTEERLSVLTPRDRKGLAGRVGVVQTDSAFVNKPTVYFPAEGGRPDIRLFRLDPRHLELVEGPPEPRHPQTPSMAASAGLAHNPSPTVAPPPTPTPEPEGGGNLSQEDLDNFFD